MPLPIPTDPDALTLVVDGAAVAEPSPEMAALAFEAVAEGASVAVAAPGRGALVGTGERGGVRLERRIDGRPVRGVRVEGGRAGAVAAAFARADGDWARGLRWGDAPPLPTADAGRRQRLTLAAMLLITLLVAVAFALSR